MGRAERAAERRLAWHQGRVDGARTRKEALWAACGWLVSEANRAGGHELDAALEMVLNRVHEIREGVSDDRNSYAA